jgi:hypothetical protein
LFVVISLKKAVWLAAGLSLALVDNVAVASSPVTISPPSRTQRVGDHLAFLALTNGVSVLAWQWQLNGTNISGQASSSLSLTNIQLTNAGTYSVLATLSSGPTNATATLTVSSGFLPLASTNLVVARLGDGLQSLNTTTGNTVYLDQIATNGNYLSTIMVPDSGSSALIAEGSGSPGLDGSVLTLSSNGQYLNLAGYNQALPNGGVTFTGENVPRAVGAVNGWGVYTLCLTNYGLYDGGSGQIRCAVSTDGTVNNFWTAGIASSGSVSIKTLTFNQGPNGILADGGGNDPRVLNIFGGNLWLSSGNSGAGQTQGLYSFTGLPSGSPSTSATLQVSTGATSDPNDFAFSPDGLTVYIADDDNFTSSTGAGGIERWDNNGSAWVFNYTLGTGTGNWGARGLTVDFSHFPGGGSSARGAIVYATTAESSTNRLIQIADSSGAGSPVTVLATAGPSQVFRGVRFGPSSYPLSAMESDADEINVVTYGAKGDGVTDDSAAFISALAAGTSHNGVYVPMGKYVISQSLTVSLEELVGKFEGGWPADTMPMPTLLIRQTSAPAVILTNGASLHGIAIVYDQSVPTTSNAPAISLRGNGVSISSVRIQNPYDGMNTYTNSTPGRARISDLYVVSPVHVGLQITKCYDFVQYRRVEVRCTNAMSSGAAFIFARVDEGSYFGLLASNCSTGLEFDHDASVNPAGGDFTGGFTGCNVQNCLNAITVNGGLHKVKISGGSFTSSNGVVINGASEVTLVGGQWQTSTGESVEVLSATNVILDACLFSRPAAYAAPLVYANNCAMFTMNYCQVLPGSTGVQLGPSITQAIVVGNSLEDGTISNLVPAGQYVVGTNLITASPPSGLAAVAEAGAVLLTWNASVQATSYNVQRSLVSGGPYTTVASPSGTAYTNTGLTNGVTYYYVVSAIRPSGPSGNSSQVSATPAALEVDFSYSPAASQLNLAWPAWASNYILYMTTNLSAPAAGAPVTNAPQSNNGAFNLSLPTTNQGQEFFQLGPP